MLPISVPVSVADLFNLFLRIPYATSDAIENFMEQGINSTFYLCFLLFTLHYASLLPALHHVSYVANAMMFTHGK